MKKLMNQAEHEKIMKRLEANELYQRSKSIHKGFQFRIFTDLKTGLPVVGQQVQYESGRMVLYNFTDGVLNSQDDEPAVQYPGHQEYWKDGLITKVVTDGGDTEEYWEDGDPVRIETNLAERRSNGEKI